MRGLLMTLICSMVCAVSYAQSNIYISVKINDDSVDKNMHQVIEDIFQEQLSSINYQVRVSRDFGDFEEERERELRYQNSSAVSINDAILPGDEMPVEQLCVISVEKIGLTYYFRAKVFDLESKKLYRTAYYPGTDDEEYDSLDIRTIQSVAAKLVAKLGYNEQNANKLAEQIKKRRDGEIKKAKRTANTTALAYSIIPGIGLIMKGHKAEGAVYMVGDIVLIGGGLAFMANANKQKDIMNNHSTGIDQYKSAVKKYNSSKTAAYCCFGTAAGLYIVNLVRSYVAKPKPDARLEWAFVPSVAPSMYGEPNMSVNLALSYKF